LTCWSRTRTSEDTRIAEALGMSPKSLMKNSPGPKQRWRLPVKLWIRELYELRSHLRRATSRENGSQT
jgi:pyrroloquinoline quinone (PQQ) biosynthesis protein C